MSTQVINPVRNSKALSNGKIGMGFFIGTEMMLFMGFISTFLVIKANALTSWPPINQPRLPLGVTAINTIILLISGVTCFLAVRSAQAEKNKSFKYLVVSLFLGLIFLGVQGWEWIQLLRHGLTLTSSLYGGTFYTLIGLHAFHVLLALIALARVTFKSKKGAYLQNANGLEMLFMYWSFVVVIWPVLYGLVYLY